MADVPGQGLVIAVQRRGITALVARIKSAQARKVTDFSELAA
ncbi:hypothetical protein [Nocardia sp. NPDC059228]